MPFKDFKVTNANNWIYSNLELPKNSIIKSITLYHAQSTLTMWFRLHIGQYTVDPIGSASLIWSAGQKQATAVGITFFPCNFVVNNVKVPDGKLSYWQYSTGNHDTCVSIYYEVE